ncbi:hypothetical protein IV203_001531 [Nitzschia inconspicua]|uniref:Uncharacterized protein n=1 Tax=Nitzschia inconspicua TaxID=303405 RepID=A0A9K3L7V3_9STRA|nr:hypothetical protein IV203_001531 [Nitzschia inconspicua]
MGAVFSFSAFAFQTSPSYHAVRVHALETPYNGLKSHGNSVVAPSRSPSASVLLHLSDDNNNGSFENDSIPDDNDKISGEDSKFNAEIVRRQLESLILSDETSGKLQDDTNDVTSERKPFSLTQFLSECRGVLSPKGGDDISRGKKPETDCDTYDSVVFESLLPPRPPMSPAERMRREREIQLLQLLEDNDDVSGDLWDLWYSERGPVFKDRLTKTDSLLANPNTWKQCEKQLLELINDPPSSSDESRPGVYFVEAINRMATLYFLQGRLKDSYALCRLVIYLKPWHFGALSGIVQVSIGLGNRNEARFWAERRLPTLLAGTSFPPFSVDIGSENVPRNPRRKEWCRIALENASMLLAQAEVNTGKQFGKPEDYYVRKGLNQTSRSMDPDEDEEAWQ